MPIQHDLDNSEAIELPLLEGACMSRDAMWGYEAEESSRPGGRKGRALTRKMILPMQLVVSGSVAACFAGAPALLAPCFRAAVSAPFAVAHSAFPQLDQSLGSLPLQLKFKTWQLPVAR